jgi:GNAT superfamily N-acetyltransferase
VPEPAPPLDRFVATIVPGALVVRERGAVLGYAWARPRGMFLHVVHVITDPSARRRGVARLLLVDLAAPADEGGALSRNSEFPECGACPVTPAAVWTRVLSALTPAGRGNPMQRCSVQSPYDYPGYDPLK